MKWQPAHLTAAHPCPNTSAPKAETIHPLLNWLLWGTPFMLCSSHPAQMPEKRIWGRERTKEHQRTGIRLRIFLAASLLLLPFHKHLEGGLV